MPYQALPAVFSLSRCIEVSDAALFNLFEASPKSPLIVVDHRAIGTQNLSKGAKDVANPIWSHYAKTHHEACGFSVEFAVKSISLKDSLGAFSSKPGKESDKEGAAKPKKVEGKNASEFLPDYYAFLDKALANGSSVEQVCLRYVRNLVNGRFLWRNRMIAQSAQVHITADKQYSFDALSYKLDDFSNPCANEVQIAQHMLAGLRGERTSALKVVAEVAFGMTGSFNVFPSQLYLGDTIEHKEAKLSKALFTKRVKDMAEYETPGVTPVGQGFIRNDKIANAIRTIDTWYPEHDETGKAIAVEITGANLRDSKFYRAGKSTGFEILKNVDVLDPTSEEGMFLTAVTIRGGVLGG